MAYDARAVVRFALQQMEAVPARPLVVVARRCGVSRHTLVRAFARCDHRSPASWRDECIRSAMETLMLATPPMTIKEVSDHLGFATPRSFARWLKRKDGILPREFRQVLCLFPRTPA